MCDEGENYQMKESAGLFKYIKAAQFFPNYAPGVKDWRKKLTGKNGRGNPTAFTLADNDLIKRGIKALFKDLY